MLDIVGGDNHLKHILEISSGQHQINIASQCPRANGNSYLIVGQHLDKLGNTVKNYRIGLGHFVENDFLFRYLLINRRRIKAHLVIAINRFNIFPVSIAQVFLPMNGFWNIHPKPLEYRIQCLVMQKLRIRNYPVKIKYHCL